MAIAVGLAMDAFAVSIAAGIVIKHPRKRQYFRLAFHFGLFQFMMPVVGWYAGRSIESLISSVDHWIAFGLLGFVGGKMLLEARKKEDGELLKDPTKGWTLVTLSVATSIDALAVGLSMAFISPTIWGPALIIGLVTASLVMFGLKAGCRLGERTGRLAQVLGGCILIFIGIKILVEHLAG